MKNVYSEEVVDRKLGQLAMFTIGLVFLILGFVRWISGLPINPYMMLLLSMASISFAVGDFGKYLNKPFLQVTCYAIAFIWGICSLATPQLGFFESLSLDISGFTDFATLFALSIPFISRGIWSVLPMRKDGMPHHQSADTSSDT